MERLQDVTGTCGRSRPPRPSAGYHSAASLEQELRQLAEARPDIAELQEIGRSVEGRAIQVLRIGERHGREAPRIPFMGCHHAREWIAVEVPFLLAAELVERADDPPIAGWLVSWLQIQTPMIPGSPRRIHTHCDRVKLY